ncbi:AAA family ATPase [Candidatus Falkowbacteria bacterium]|jgi:PhoH-like ATPase|nr:AAA family ATPase [Candidatus Falkowbacteria bacterium]
MNGNGRRNPGNRTGKGLAARQLNNAPTLEDQHDFRLKLANQPVANQVPKLTRVKRSVADLPVKEEKTGRNIIVVDTNVLFDNFNALKELRKGGNLLVIPLMVFRELDKHKKDPRLSYQARKLISEIDKLQEKKDSGLIVEHGLNFSNLNLDRSEPDHKIIACLNFVYLAFLANREPYNGFDKVKMISNDGGVKVVSRGINSVNKGSNKKAQIIVEEYKKAKTKIRKKDVEIPFLYVSKEKVASDWEKGATFSANGFSKLVADGSAMIGYTNKKNAEKGEFAAIRQGDIFKIISPKISCYGVRPKAKEEFGRNNWEQAIAMYYVLEPSFDCVFLQGSAGSGKTLIAIAAALEQKEKGLYSKVVIFRVPEPVDRKKTLGLLPGDAGAKIGPYIKPIAQTLKKLLSQKEVKKASEEENKAVSSSKKKSKAAKSEKVQNNVAKNKSTIDIKVDEIFEKHGFEVAVLEYVRGETIDDAFIIIDDAQNLSQHEIKTLITRAGEKTKLVFTGDLGQIDSPYISESTSGLAHAITKMGSYPNIGVVVLKQTLRSPIASLAEKVL